MDIKMTFSGLKKEENPDLWKQYMISLEFYSYYAEGFKIKIDILNELRCSISAAVRDYLVGISSLN